MKHISIVIRDVANGFVVCEVENKGAPYAAEYIADTHDEVGKVVKQIMRGRWSDPTPKPAPPKAKK
jgi:hypothetical protein